MQSGKKQSAEGYFSMKLLPDCNVLWQWHKKDTEVFRRREQNAPLAMLLISWASPVHFNPAASTDQGGIKSRGYGVGFIQGQLLSGAGR